MLHIVKNYTGDVMNFEMAADLGNGEGIDVEAVVTNDDGPALPVRRHGAGVRQRDGGTPLIELYTRIRAPPRRIC